MFRDILIVVTTVAYAAAFTSCTASPVLPETPKVSDSVQGDSAPLAVDWPAGPRADLEVALHDGLAVVRLDEAGLKLVEDCRVDGTYGFVGVTRKEQTLRFEDSDTISVAMPFGGATLAARLGAGLGKSTVLDLALVIVGKQRSPRVAADRTNLRGAGCAHATHYVRGFNVGAFVLESSAKANAVVVASAVNGDSGIASHASKAIREVDGQMEACKGSTPADRAPPTNCGAIVRLELKPIAEAAAVESPACPKNLVRTDVGCQQRDRATAYQCSPNDEDECVRQCERGDAESCGLAARLLAARSGNGSAAKQATEVATRGCLGGSMTACVELGLLRQYGVEDKADIAEAGRLFERACEAGEAVGCYRLGLLYDRAPGLPLNVTRAAALYDRACRAGMVEGCNTLGAMALTGRGQPASASRAREIFEMACLNGSAFACGNLGDLDAAGVGGAQNLQRASEYWELACAESPSHCISLAEALLDGRLPKEPARAANLGADGIARLGKLCDAGRTERCVDLAWAQHRGLITPRDDERSAGLLARACAAGDPGGCNDWGVFLAAGWGAPKDAPGALEAFTRACTLGEVRGCHNESNHGSRQDRTARLKKACDRGANESCFELARERWVSEDEAVAKADMEALCQRRHAPACAYMARRLSFDKAAAQQSRTLIDRACELDDVDACATRAIWRTESRQDLARTAPEDLAALRKACHDGAASACMELGRLSAPPGSNASPSAESWWTRGCELGHPASCSALAEATKSSRPEVARRAQESACALAYFSETEFVARLRADAATRSALEAETLQNLHAAAERDAVATARGPERATLAKTGAKSAGSNSAMSFGAKGGEYVSHDDAVFSLKRFASSGRSVVVKNWVVRRDAQVRARRDQDARAAAEPSLSDRFSGCVGLIDSPSLSAAPASAGLAESMAACDAGDATACRLAAERTQDSTLQWLLLMEGCDLRNGLACRTLAQRQRPDDLPGDPPDNAQLLERACWLGSPDLCPRAWRSMLNARSQPDAERRALKMMVMHCVDDDAPHAVQGCVEATHLLKRQGDRLSAPAPAGHLISALESIAR
jgi:TPR repeat protein